MRTSPKFEYASRHVYFNVLAGYVSKKELCTMLYNAVLKSGEFESVSLYDSSNALVDTNQTHKKDLKVFVRSNPIHQNRDSMLQFQRVLSDASDITGSCYFDLIEDYNRSYIGKTNCLCYTIDWVDRNNNRNPVADVIWPNIVCIRLVDIKFGSSGAKKHEHKSSLRALSYIIKEAVSLLSGTKREFLSKIITGRKEKLTYIMYKQLEEAVYAVNQKIQSGENKIADYRKKIQELEISLDADKKQLQAYDNIMNNLRGKFIREIDTIKNISQVTAVDEYTNIDKGIISVDVADIKVRCQRNWYYLGNYTIDINISEKTVRFKNTSNILRRSYWGPCCHHPHCNGDGKPCLGNISTQVIELICSLDLAFLVNLCISYLQSVNVNDAAGRYIVNWPVCDENGNILSERNESGIIRCRVCGCTMPEIDNDDWMQCDDCGEWACGQHTKHIDTALGEILVCDSCYENYKQCPSCGNYELRDLFTQCPICAETVCQNCASDEIQRYAYYRGSKIDFMCNKHHVHKCESCGLLLAETDICPSCEEGLFSVEKCAVCGETTPVSLFREDFSDVCTYCDVDGLEKCSRCRRYDQSQNLSFDVVTGEYYHDYECTAELDTAEDISDNTITV